MEPRTRPSLLRRLKDGADGEAWRDFDARYGELIQRYCLRLGLQEADADEVRQNVLLGLAASLRRFEYDPAKGRFRSYLGRIVARAVGRHRGRSRRPERALSTELRAGLVDPASGELERVWRQEWMRHHYRRAFERIRRRHAPQSLEMFERLLAGASIAEVAAAFGVTPAAVHKVKQRFRDQLAALIAEQVAEEERDRAG